MSQFYYILEANIYLLLFFVFYRLVLQHETFHKLNRYYLLTVAILSFLLPCLQWNVLSAETTVINGFMQPPRELSNPIVDKLFNVTDYAFILYLIITAYFLSKFGASLFKLFLLIRKSEVKHWNGTRRIDMYDQGSAFSFLNYLFVDPKLPALETVLAHELVHVRQYHTIDILLLELMHALNWFNPIIPLMKKELKSVHEYLADEEALISEKDAESYSIFLIRHSSGKSNEVLTSQIFSTSLLKRRIQRVFMERSRPTLKVKYLILFPLCVIFLIFSSMAFPKSYSLFDLMKTEKVVIDSSLTSKPEETRIPKVISNPKKADIKHITLQPRPNDKPIPIKRRKAKVDTVESLEITIIPISPVDSSKLKKL